MFERFTEKARRAIFFARYEASQYGSPIIETEHLLLGVLREDDGLAKWFPGQFNVGPEIRSEIEKRITQRDRIPTASEVPLSDECKMVLKLSIETADRLAHRVVEPEHILIGILRVEQSLGAQILIARGLKADPILVRLANDPSPRNRNVDAALMTLESFLAGLKSLKSEELLSFFAEYARFIDASGKTWNRTEISNGFDTLFAPYAKKNASYVIETTLAKTSELFITTVRWSNALLASEQRAWMHRMGFVLVPEETHWAILFVQVTSVAATK
jgi:Clp amino terminal domain, pathogenicity island component